MLGRAGICGLLLAVVATVGIAATGVAVADVTDQSVAYQVDAGHDGWLQGVDLPSPLQRQWSDVFDGDVTDPLVVDGTVYVAAIPTGGDETELFALNEATGKTLWQHDLGGAYGAPGIAYDGGRVFAVDSGGLLTAFDAVTGTIDWSSQLPDQYMFSAAPTAIDGIVYTGGAGVGGNLYATDEATGALLWTQLVENGDDSSPAVDASHVYVDYPCQYYAFDRTTGALDWHDSLGCDGGGGDTPVAADGHVFIRDWTEPGRIVSASDGSLQAPLGSDSAPAVANGIAYERNGGLLEAVPDDGMGSVAWTFSGDDGLDTAPLAIGSTVWMGSSTGELYEVDGVTGQELWSTEAGATPGAPNLTLAVSEMSAGDNSLLVVAGSTLVDYAAPAAVFAPVSQLGPTILGQLGVGQQVSADVGEWSTTPTGFSYSWERCDSTGAACSSVAGATSANYVVQSADVGSTLRVVVTAANAAGPGDPATSPATVVVPAAPTSVTVVQTPAPASAGSTSARPLSGNTSTTTAGQSTVVAQAASLRRAISARATVARVLANHGAQLTLSAPSSGRMVVEWFAVPAGAKKSVLLGLGKLSFSQAGSRVLRLRLSTRGERTLARFRGGASILALAEFSPSQGQPVVAQRQFRLGG